MVASLQELRTVSLELIRSVLPAKAGIRLVGVTVSTFGSTEAVALTLSPDQHPRT